MIGAIVLRCSDSRNGSVEKALKKHFGWPTDVRVKTLAWPGGAHSHDFGHEIVVRQVMILTSVLKKMGASEIVLVFTDHDHCGYVEGFGKKQIEKYWVEPDFLREIFGLAPEIQKAIVASVGYSDHEKPTVPSTEIKIKIHKSVKRKN